MSHAEATIRPATFADAAGVSDIVNARSMKLTGESKVTPEEVLHDWKEPGYDVGRNTRVVETRDGDLAALFEFFPDTGAHVRHYAYVTIHPERTAHVDTAALLAWLLERARSEVPHAPEGARVHLIVSTLERDAELRDLWGGAGFAESRRFYQMRIDLAERPAGASVPDGYSLRAMRSGEEWDTFVATHTAFQDHYGSVKRDASEKEFEEFKHGLLGRDDHDPDLMLLAVADSGAIAGVCLSTPSYGSMTDMGWVAALGVLPGHRRRGLGEAMLRRSFELFREKGKARAGLGVDATSLTNATALYERCGMHQHRVSVQYDLVLRDGVELAKTE